MRIYLRILAAVIMTLGATGCVSSGSYGYGSVGYPASYRPPPRPYYGGFDTNPYYGRSYRHDGLGSSYYGNLGGHFSNRSIYRGQFGRH